MQFETFKNLAVATESPPEAVWDRLHSDKELDRIYVQSLEDLSAAAEKLDLVKKALYYGKPEKLLELKKAYKRNIFSRLLTKPQQFVYGIVKTPEDIEIIRVGHCTLGVATESGELADALLPAIKRQKKLDIVNILEEFGDVAWYLGVVFTVLKADTAMVFGGIIKKLTKRYGDRFNAYLAENRNLEAERKILDEYMK